MSKNNSTELRSDLIAQAEGLTADVSVNLSSLADLVGMLLEACDKDARCVSGLHIINSVVAQAADNLGKVEGLLLEARKPQAA